jgi:hypothetical protein
VSFCERSQHIFPSTPSATPNKTIKLMVEGEVNDATSDEDSDNEQLSSYFFLLFIKINIFFKNKKIVVYDMF